MLTKTETALFRRLVLECALERDQSSCDDFYLDNTPELVELARTALHAWVKEEIAGSDLDFHTTMEDYTGWEPEPGAKNFLAPVRSADFIRLLLGRVCSAPDPTDYALRHATVWEVQSNGKRSRGTYAKPDTIRERIVQLERQLACAEAIEAAKARFERGPELRERVRVQPGQPQEYVGVVTQIEGGKVLVEVRGGGGEWVYFSSTAVAP